MNDYDHYRLPVSVKGVVRIDGRVLLCLNDRDQWELPGGRLEAGEQPRETCARELMEETGVTVAVHASPLLTEVVAPVPGRQVLIVAYACRPLTDSEPVASHEHVAVGLFTDDEVDQLDNLPQLYKNAIALSAR